MKALLDRRRQALLENFPQLEHLTRTAGSVAVNAGTASIVITCKNKASTLPRVLERIAEQTRRPDLVILADDASTDGSVALFAALCREYDLDRRVVALPAGGNFRLNTIRNRGFEASPDGIVMLIDGDVILSPAYIERHLAIHARQPSAVVTMGPRFEYATDELAGPVDFMWGYGVEQQGFDSEAYLPAWQRAHGAMCLARSVWEAVGGFDENYDGKYGIDDIDFVFRLFLAGVFPISEFEGYCIHIPHPTGFEGGKRDPKDNVAYFCWKYGLPEAVFGDDIDYTALRIRQGNWALDFGRFRERLLLRGAAPSLAGAVAFQAAGLKHGGSSMGKEAAAVSVALDRAAVAAPKPSTAHARGPRRALATPRDTTASSIAAEWAGDHPYYERAEQADWLEPFWREGSRFRSKLDRLDLTSYVELACGHGRHTHYLLDVLKEPRVREAWLVDVNEDNIRFCARRFAGDARVRLLQNGGEDFAAIADASVTAVFCYDAMVHFEYSSVCSYLAETYRILVPGGRALLHHSNYDGSPGAYYRDNPHWRNFMTKPLFAHVARRAGFTILEQDVIDWYEAPALDCISLVEKPLLRSEARP